MRGEKRKKKKIVMLLWVGMKQSAFRQVPILLWLHFYKQGIIVHLRKLVGRINETDV